jgi:REP element-mobilizing transposase RayT
MNPKYDPKKHHRRSIRLKGYDYSQKGVYFITVCVNKQQCLLGDVVNGKTHLNKYGRIVKEQWLLSSEMRSEIELDVFVIMPNHFHGIVIISNTNTVGANGRSPLQMKPKSLSSLMAGFKSSATSRINRWRNMPGFPVWQRSYYEHIIRSEDELNSIREYILNNPLHWQFDMENPRHIQNKVCDNQWRHLEETIYGKAEKTITVKLLPLHL